MLRKITTFIASAIFCPLALSSPTQNTCDNNTLFQVGAGIYDITGPAAQEGMMGYAVIDQKTAGIYQRLWARAFVIESPCNQQRVVFVNADLGQLFQGIKQQVVLKLQEKYGNQYSDKNILITATHEHSGPGGYSTYTLYNLSTLGFSHDNFNTIVNGIVAAIERAQNNMKPTEIKIADGELSSISFNRSEESYLLNPQQERDRYQSNIDTTMTLIRFDTINGNPTGIINWFPVHGVSMSNKNRLINGDNKGYAEYLFEKDFNSHYGNKAFVAAFAQANAGDITPNAHGTTGGSGLEGVKKVEEAGSGQYRTAKDLFQNAQEQLSGGVEYRHVFIDMEKIAIAPTYADGQSQKTCPAAIGISMLAGTTDGEMVGKQGVSCDTLKNKIPDFVCDIISTPCQGVKPIVLQPSLMKPYSWVPTILPLQIFKIGNLVIVAAPFELTTMTGRRIKETVASIFPENYHVVLSTLANAYAGYVATPEEYQLQRYEGASTLFGPYTLPALQQEFAKLAHAIVDNQSLPAGPTPLDLLPYQISLQPGVVFDDKPPFKNFGDIYRDVAPTYRAGDIAEVIFWGAHPKNNFRTQDSFLAIQRFENGQWLTILEDRDWETEYHWHRNAIAYSHITIAWRIARDTPPGKYRIVHYGDWKSLGGKISPYAGFSSNFTVIN
jgi:neutral ceramidase